MTQLVTAEFFKLRTTRTFYSVVGGALALELGRRRLAHLPTPRRVRGFAFRRVSGEDDPRCAPGRAARGQRAESGARKGGALLKAAVRPRAERREAPC